PGDLPAELADRLRARWYALKIRGAAAIIERVVSAQTHHDVAPGPQSRENLHLGGARDHAPPQSDAGPPHPRHSPRLHPPRTPPKMEMAQPPLKRRPTRGPSQVRRSNLRTRVLLGAAIGGALFVPYVVLSGFHAPLLRTAIVAFACYSLGNLIAYLAGGEWGW